MGKFMNKAKAAGNKIAKKADEFRTIAPGPIDEEDFTDLGDGFDGIDDSPMGDQGFRDDYGDVNVQQAQKPESFHHFLLENQFRDLELLIRGYKKVYNKDTNKWETKRKEKHCFTDEESEHILRLAETHLSPDIKLSYISKTSYPIKMLMIKAQLDEAFYNIADYRYGRYGDSKAQFFMKQENLNINMALMTRIEANYSRAIQGSENKHTHNAVKGQESLSNSGGTPNGDGGYY